VNDNYRKSFLSQVVLSDDWLCYGTAEYSILQNYQTKVSFTSRTQKFQTLHWQVSSWCLWIIWTVFWLSSLENWTLRYFFAGRVFHEIIQTSNNFYRFKPEYRITRRHNIICLAINDCGNQCFCQDGPYTTCAAGTFSRNSLTHSPNYREWQWRRKFFKT
jgi:hypothetical protein